jgi:hypothetical protein
VNHYQHRLCNAELAPADGDEDSVDTLAVQRGKIKGTDILVTRSFWRPTAEELALLNADGAVMLTVFGGTHAPLRVDAVPG